MCLHSVDRKVQSAAAVEVDQREGLASVRKEVLLKALESRDAIIKGLNERLSYM